MPHPFQTTLALMSAACALGAVTPAQAHDERAVVDPSQGLSAQRVGVDPVSRQLRHVTESEARELDSIASTVPATRRQITQTITSRPMAASASRGMRLGTEHLSFTRVARHADGTLVSDCVTGDQLATPIAGQTRAVAGVEHE